MKTKEEKSSKPKRIPLRPYTLIELSRLYCVDRTTFRKWIKMFEDKLGKRAGNFYTVKQVKIILEHLDDPGEIEQ